MISIVQLAASAALGAFIGYATNAIAIKSLFRPLKPRWYTLGWQGVIPRNRVRMAENISRVVGEDLLGRDYLLEQVHGAALQESLQGYIADKVGRALSLDLAGVFTRLPAAWQEQGLEEVVRRGLEFVGAWREGGSGRGAREWLVDVLLAHLRERELAQVLPSRQVEDLAAALGRTLGRKQTREHLQRILRAQLEDYLGADRPLEELVPQDLRELLHARLKKQVPDILARVATWLQAPENVEHISDRILVALETYAERESLLRRLVGELGLRLFREQIRIAVRERIPRVAHDYLHSVETQKRVEEQLIGGVERFLQRPLKEVVGGHHEFLAAKIGFIAATWISSPEVQDRLQGLLMDHYRERAPSRLDDLLPDRFWNRAREDLLEVMQIPPERIPGWSAALATWLRRQLRHSRVQLRDWAGMTSKNEEALIRQLREKATELLQTEVPVLLKQFDLRDLVRAKIMAFDLLRVEGLIKDIISDQLRFINLLGAVLGGLVGLLLPFLNAWIAALNP